MFAVVDWPQMKPGTVVPALAGTEPAGQTFGTEGKKNPKLVVLVKIDRPVRYKYMVNLIDQLQFAELNRFSLAPLTPEEKRSQPAS